MHSDTQSRPRHSHTHARRLCKCKNEIERSKNRKVENLIYWSGNTDSILPLSWQPATPRTWHFALSSQQRTKWIIIILLRISLLSSSKWTNALSFALFDPNRQSNLKLCVCTRRLNGDGDACSLWELQCIALMGISSLREQSNAVCMLWTIQLSKGSGLKIRGGKLVPIKMNKKIDNVTRPNEIQFKWMKTNSERVRERWMEIEWRKHRSPMSNVAFTNDTHTQSSGQRVMGRFIHNNTARLRLCTMM